MKAGAIDFNSSAKVVTVLYALYLVVAISTVLLLGPFIFVTTPPQPLAGSLAVIASSIIGFRASRMFGGRRNFTGRLVSNYSVALFLQAISWVAWGLFANGQVPRGSTLILLTSASLAGYTISAYTLLRSAKAIIIRIDRRVVAPIVIALVFSLTDSIVVYLVTKTPADHFVWGGIWPTLIFAQLASGLILVSSLGKWYMAKPLRNIAFGYVAYSVAASTTSIINLSVPVLFPAVDFWVVVSFFSATILYFIGFQMTQVRPKPLATPPGVEGGQSTA